MATMIFVNLPVKDLNKSVDFFTRLGYTFNPKFTSEEATCMIVSDTIFVMLLVEPFFRTFMNKDIADTSKSAEVIVALSAESREAVDETIRKAVDAGGLVLKEPIDYSYMYGHGFQDLDGHLWEYTWMA